MRSLRCPKCDRLSPNVAKYCLHCGKSLREMRGEGKHYLRDLKTLEVSLTADFSVIISKLVQLYGYRLKSEPTVEQVVSALQNLRADHLQVLIRVYGLDGLPPRHMNEVAYEAGVTQSGVYSCHREAMMRLMVETRFMIERSA